MKRPSQIIIILSTITITSLVVTGYFYTELERLRTNPQILATNELQDIVAKVGQLIVLPENEQPTLMTIADPEQLRDQPFFARAKAGDKVLVYNQAAKAILYDPVGHKIVEVAPITNNPQT